jgi:hypothetical protein
MTFSCYSRHILCNRVKQHSWFLKHSYVNTHPSDTHAGLLNILEQAFFLVMYESYLDDFKVRL